MCERNRLHHYLQAFNECVIPNFPTNSDDKSIDFLYVPSQTETFGEPADLLPRVWLTGSLFAHHRNYFVHDPSAEVVRPSAAARIVRLELSVQIGPQKSSHEQCTEQMYSKCKRLTAQVLRHCNRFYEDRFHFEKPSKC